MVQKQAVSLRRLGGNRAGEMRLGRFLKNPKVTVNEVISSGCLETAARVRGGHLLAIQDTTECNYQAHAKRATGLGTVGNGTDAGFFAHPLLALEAESGACLGLAHLHLWERTGAADAHYRRLPIEEKESHRWIETALAGKACLHKADQLTIVADRESDIYELWARVPDTRTHLLIRACRDRALATGEEERLFVTMDQLPLAGSYLQPLPARLEKKRSAHTAQLHVRFGKVTLRRPLHCSDPQAPPQLTLYVIDVREDPATVVGTESPIHWRLLTTHPVTRFEQAVECIQWYRQRWHIEQLFRTLKRQGLDIESSQLESGKALKKLCCLAIFAAVRIMQLTLAREGRTDRPGTDAFSEREIEVLCALTPTLEGATLKQKNPHPIASLAWAAWIIARLGGWNGYASERKPGPITLHRGLRRFYSLYEGWMIRDGV